jgi:hypothetical protein
LRPEGWVVAIIDSSSEGGRSKQPLATINKEVKVKEREKTGSWRERVRGRTELKRGRSGIIDFETDMHALTARQAAGCQ